jgi:hypothetical protein
LDEKIENMSSESDGSAFDSEFEDFKGFEEEKYQGANTK